MAQTGFEYLTKPNQAKSQAARQRSHLVLQICFAPQS